MSDRVELYNFGAKIVESERSQRVGTHVRDEYPYRIGSAVCLAVPYGSTIQRSPKKKNPFFINKFRHVPEA